MQKNPYHIIKYRHITEKASVLSGLEVNESNLSVRRCNRPKVLFVVDINATKPEIAWAVEKIYERRNVKVHSVNTIIMKPKPKKLKGRPGKTPRIKKAVVTLYPGHSIETKG